ncbi:MAG: response regulator [Candidatus Omnitrophica bacterium]|nr:response regulator [Candidatus Omnitrophota bacterium]
MAKKILIADPDLGFTDVLINGLQEKGFEVETVYEGDVALRKARKEMPDLLIAEIQLPAVDGLKLCRFIKFDKKRSRIKVIFVTTEEDEETKKITKEVGADQTLFKSEAIPNLIERISGILQ